MALTRKMLKGMSLTDEQIDTIIEAHTETVDALKEQRDQYKANAEMLPQVQKQLDSAKEQLESAGDASYKAKYDSLKAEMASLKADYAAKETHGAKERAYRELLRAAGIPDKRLDTVLRVSKVDDVELDEEGKIKDAGKLSESIKTEWADFIPTVTETGAPTPTPPAGTGGMTKAEIYKKDDRGRYVLSAAERQKAIAENPDEFGI